jgi:CHC2 zinc finger
MRGAELDELKSRPGNSCAEVAERLGCRLRRYGREKMGPCPICSSDLQSKTATRWQTKDGGWVCAACEDGGDVIALVSKALNLDFKGAVDWLGGISAIP